MSVENADAVCLKRRLCTETGSVKFPDGLQKIKHSEQCVADVTGLSTAIRCSVAETEFAEFRPTDMFASDKSDLRIALVILNGEDNCQCIAKHLNRFWNRSELRVCADGAINKLHKLNQKADVELLPTIICGDFDSCDVNIVKYYENKNVHIHKDEDQNTTDFTKCVALLKNLNFIKFYKLNCIIALGGLCGRFDHVLGCLQTLFKSRLKYEIVTPLYLLHNDNLVVLLPQGRSRIHIDRKLVSGKCGLIPVGFPAMCVTTTGLKYNSTKGALSFGNLISSSNTIVSDCVEVISDVPLIWTMELNIGALQPDSTSRL